MRSAISSAPACRATRPVLAALVLALACGGCDYTTQSGLPGHVRTVDVGLFKNKTFHLGLETRLTRAIIEKLTLDPHVRLVNDGGDATISGEILTVQRRVLRETRGDDPATIRQTIVVRYDFRDNTTGAMLINGEVLHSLHASAGAGVYDVQRGEGRSAAEERNVRELADKIVRRTVGMW